MRALKPPIPQIAAAIDAGDISFLKSLPGIGEQRAKEIIAKLQGKMGKFGLMRSEKTGRNGAKAVGPHEALDIQAEALEILMQLQYKKDEARDMVQKALGRKPDASSAEDILNEVYRQRKAAGSQ